MTIKISAADVQRLLYAASDELKAASEKNAALEAELAVYKKREKAMKLAQEMQDKGLSPSWGGDDQSAVSHMMDLPDERLDQLEGIVDLAAPHNPLASFEAQNDRGEGTSDEEISADMNHPFVQFLMGNIQ